MVELLGNESSTFGKRKFNFWKVLLIVLINSGLRFGLRNGCLCINMQWHHDDKWVSEGAKRGQNKKNIKMLWKVGKNV